MDTMAEESKARQTTTPPGWAVHSAASRTFKSALACSPAEAAFDQAGVLIGFKSAQAAVASASAPAVVRSVFAPQAIAAGRLEQNYTTTAVLVHGHTAQPSSPHP
ncbi:hypothetical protein [Arthrobacter oryzae]|uniref:Uncharacterized protein n=1 Tax=Arthrobacter oryzae TaxID=409290 RepID=A0A3N0BRV3_9MICC|nr:hypothetical protein [Arthrobacter oryzae]RNL51793.1 hypothetical protein D7003_14955 [Arthrobacter oryzae]